MSVHIILYQVIRYPIQINVSCFKTRITICLFNVGKYYLYLMELICQYTYEEIIAKRNPKLSPKTYWKELLAIFIVLLAFVFFRSERKEIASIGPQLAAADFNWLLVGFATTIMYILLQGVMYIYSFRSIGLKLNLWDALELFLKRNFLSVFLPAGGVSSLAYTTSQLRKKQLNATKFIKQEQYMVMWVY